MNKKWLYLLVVFASNMHSMGSLVKSDSFEEDHLPHRTGNDSPKDVIGRFTPPVSRENSNVINGTLPYNSVRGVKGPDETHEDQRQQLQEYLSTQLEQLSNTKRSLALEINNIGLTQRLIMHRKALLMAHKQRVSMQMANMQVVNVLNMRVVNGFNVQVVNMQRQMTSMQRLQDFLIHLQNQENDLQNQEVFLQRKVKFLKEQKTIIEQQYYTIKEDMQRLVVRDKSDVTDEENLQDQQATIEKNRMEFYKSDSFQGNNLRETVKNSSFEEGQGGDSQRLCSSNEDNAESMILADNSIFHGSVDNTSRDVEKSSGISLASGITTVVGVLQENVNSSGDVTRSSGVSRSSESTVVADIFQGDRNDLSQDNNEGSVNVEKQVNQNYDTTDTKEESEDPKDKSDHKLEIKEKSFFGCCF